ncbi:MAG TPA: formate--tetrahydrofolate ligase [Acidimicrobiales bacterium]|nr:formate--tetrahydrofolate ligase [Acidimicrobiales bacterium]
MISPVSLPPAIEIARRATLRPIAELAAQMGIAPDLLEPYGEYVAKVRLDAVGALADRPSARYVVVTAVTPTPLGEGKTTTTIGLGQALACIGRRATIAIRQASMGPTFGIKGGAAGGGYSQVVPFENLNLHLTGDLHAVTAANNLLAAMVDNHLYSGNELGLDPHGITWKRVLDVNDRSLRTIVSGLGSREDGTPRQTGFDITAASEVMAVLALATSLRDLRQRFGRIVVGYTGAGEPVTAEQLKAAGAMTVVMRDAIKPNLLQTLENTPVLVHSGPFGNIAHGNSSVVADLIGIHGGEYLVTEAGFGSDMGAERFFNIKCRTSGLVPDAAVVVTTVRALKLHSGRHKVVAGRPLPPAMVEENPDEVHLGAANLLAHLAIVRRHGVTPVVAVNAFEDDYPSEHEAIREIAASVGVRTAICTHFTQGGKGAVELAEAVVEACEAPSEFHMLYEDGATLRQKIETIATEVYGADGVDYLPAASRHLDNYERAGFGRLPVCIAKTHLSISSDPKLLGAPKGWRLPVREARANVGAGFVYLVSGDMRTMPGLSRHPAAEQIDIDEDGNVVGLY